jgi:VanZ family protein
MKKIIKSWLPVLLWAAIIFFFSSDPNPYKYLPEAWRSAVPLPTIIRACEGLRVFFEEQSLAEWIGQLMHFIEYLVLAFLISRALYKTSAASTKIPALVILISMLFALSDEIHQLFVPGRAFQVIDLFIDFLGSLFGVFLYSRLKIKPQRRKGAKVVKLRKRN